MSSLHLHRKPASARGPCIWDRNSEQRQAAATADAAIPLIQKALSQIEGEEGWVSLGMLGQRLSSIATDFDPRTYGYRKLSDLVRRTGAFEVVQPETGGLRSARWP